MHTTIDNIEIQKLIRELKAVDINHIEDPYGLDNIWFEKDGVSIGSCYEQFFRYHGLCTIPILDTERSKKKDMLKWIPVTDAMFYQMFKLVIIAGLNKKLLKRKGK